MAGEAANADLGIGRRSYFDDAENDYAKLER